MIDPFVSFPPAILAVLAIVAVLAGCVRGFAGFGAGMIFMPVAASLIHPAFAAAGFLLFDWLVALPLAVRAWRICDWKTILPAVLGSVLFVQVGAWFLGNTDILLLRWVIFAIVCSLLLLLVSGWRYKKKPRPAVSFGVGATSGLLGGISQVSAPPVAAFWLSSSSQASVVRANLIIFFALASIGTCIAYFLHGFFTIEVLHLLIVCVPCYAIGVLIGSRGFRKADPKLYRGIAYALIGLAAITSMPLLDEYLR